MTLQTIRTFRVLLSALEMAKRLNQCMESKFQDIPPSHYNQILKDFDDDVRQTYGKHFSESFKMLIAWSPLYR